MKNDFYDFMDIKRSFDDDKNFRKKICDFILYLHDEFVEDNGTKLESNKLTFEQFVKLKKQ